MRGSDSEFTPIPNSYLILNNKNKIYFFCNLKKIDKKVKKNLENVIISDIKNITEFLSKIKNKTVQLDSSSCSIFFKNIIKKNNVIFEKQDPIYFLKSIKNKMRN